MLCVSIVSVILIVCPYGELPLPAPNEVRMVLRHAKVVNRGDFAGVAEVFDLNPAAVVALEPVADGQALGRYPALAVREERVLAGRPDYLAADVQVQERGAADEDFLDLLGFQRSVRLELATGENQVADLEVLDVLVSVRREQRRASGEADPCE